MASEELSPDDVKTQREIADLYGEKAKELEKSETSQVASSNSDDGTNAEAIQQIPGASALRLLMDFAPFTAYMVLRANTMYSHKTNQARLNKYVREHRRVDQFCTVADLVFRSCLALILLVAVVGFVAKTILPLPVLSIN